MSEPRVVSPQEACGLRLRLTGGYLTDEHDPNGSTSIRTGLLRDVLDQISTEPDRTRAAVVKALRAEVQRINNEATWVGGYATDYLTARADAIENGADYA